VLSREQERQKQLARLPPPRLAAPGYEAVGYWLLAARAPAGTAIEYDQAIGELWVMCSSNRTLPAPKKLEQAFGVARQKLDAAYAGTADMKRRRDLERATWALKRAEEEATEAGLLLRDD
jgi:hypothetical protein